MRVHNVAAVNSLFLDVMTIDTVPFCQAVFTNYPLTTTTGLKKKSTVQNTEIYSRHPQSLPLHDFSQFSRLGK